MITGAKEQVGPQARMTVHTGAVEASEEVASELSENSKNVKAYVRAKMQSALDTALATAQPEAGEPAGWVDIYSVGPFQSGAVALPPGGTPLLPHAVIRVGELAQITGVLVLNPNPLPPSNIVPCDMLSSLQLPYEIEFITLNMTNGTPAPALSTTISGNLVPGQCIYEEVFEFVPEERGCIFETNVCFRILDCQYSSPSYSPFAGFATWVKNLDDPSFLDAFLGIPSPPVQPGFLFNTPVRYMTYR